MVLYSLPIGVLLYKRLIIIIQISIRSKCKLELANQELSTVVRTELTNQEKRSKVTMGWPENMEVSVGIGGIGWDSFENGSDWSSVCKSWRDGLEDL